MALELNRNPHPRPPVSGPRCVHHWVLDAAAGAESRGRCKHCAAERCFSNNLEFDSWGSGRDERQFGAFAEVPPKRRLELADEI